MTLLLVFFSQETKTVKIQLHYIKVYEKQISRSICRSKLNNIVSTSYLSAMSKEKMVNIYFVLEIVNKPE